MLLCSSSVQLEQGTVTSLLEDNGTVKGVQYKTKSGEELKAYAPLTIVCDGCFSNLRRALCSPKVHHLHYTYTIHIAEFLSLMDVNGNMCLG
jgi:2-polyprenyl-6-methoxyphenol hydroxylase-like FAD-dependent oxidoreductase